MPPSDKRKPGHKEQCNKGDKLTQELSAKGLCKDANASKCIWARVKGYPWWPAQVLSKAAAKQHLGNVTHKSKTDVPVIFFGTSEIAWIGCKDISHWEEGMRQSFQNKGRKNKKFVVALEQVRDFLSITSERITPHGWWTPAPGRNAAPVPDEPFTSEDEAELQQDEQQQLVGLQRQYSGIGRYGVAAIVAAAAAADGSLDAHMQHAAAVAANNASAAGVVVAGITRHSALADDEDCDYGSNRRPAYSRQQLWKSSSRRGSETGHGDELNHCQPDKRRRRSITGHGYVLDSWSDQDEQQDEEFVTADHCRGVDKHQLGKPGGHHSSLLQRRKRLLLQQEGHADGPGSEGDMTDTESVAMAAMAIAELAQCSSWDQRHHESAAEEAAATAAEVEEEPLMQMTALGQQEAYEQLQDDRLVRVKLEVQEDGVGLGVVVKQDMPAVAAAASAVAVGSCHQLPPHFGLPPSAAIQHQQQHKSHLATLGCLVAAAGLEYPELPGSEHAVQQQHLAAVLPVHPPGKYEHGGVGLPSTCSWSYSVAMPCVAPAVDSSVGSAAASERSEQVLQQTAAASSGQQSPKPQEQLQQGGSSTVQAAAAVVAVPSGNAAVQEVPAVSVCAGTAYYRHMFASFGHAPADTDEHEAAEDLSAAAVDSHHAAAAVAPIVERSAAAAAAAVPLGPRRARASVPKYVAAANAAIMAAFSGGMPASHALAAPAMHAALGATAAAAAAGGSSNSSAARSEGSGGSAAVSGSKGSTWQRRRANGSAGSSVVAASAAAAAAAHVLTPADPVLDPAVGRLLLDHEPVLPLAQDNYLGFQLPREMLMNRPPRFEMLKRNLFVSRERPKRLPKDEVQVCCCRVRKVLMPDGTVGHTGCDHDCLNRLSFIHCDPRTCPCGQYCSNKPFHLLKAPELDVFLTVNRGHGVRVNAPLPQGTFVMEYAGEVIDQAELNRRMEAARDSGEQHFYIMEMGPGLFIDARKKGNYARLLNSCCEPNCETQKWRDAATGEVRIGIFTTRAVASSEELTYDYMFEHYGLSSGLAQGFKCQCGAKNCRGTMDINPERKRDWGRRLEVFWEGDGVFYRGTITGYSTSSGKHTIMYDDGDLERVNLNQVPHRWLDGDASPHSSAQLPSGSPLPKHGTRTSPLPVTQPLLAGIAAAAEAADSGSWSQTEQEAAAEDQLLSSPRAAAAAGKPGPSRAARILGLSPLGPGGAARALDAAVAPTAGVKRPLHLVDGQQADEEDEGSLDDEAAADALVVLGMAAEAELAVHGNQPHQQHGRIQQAAVDDAPFQRPQMKKRRLDGYVVDPLGRAVGQWPHSSSTSSQSACLTHVGFNGALDGASPLSPAGRVGGHAVRTLPGLNNTGARAVAQGDAMDVDGGTAVAAPAAGSGEEYLPWEQLLSGISAIKRQGPSLFQPRPALVEPAKQQQPVVVSSAAAQALQASRCKFGHLLNLVGQMQPVIQQKQMQLGSVLGAQQSTPGLESIRLSASGGIGRVGSCGGSSSCSTNSSCQLPLFCCGGNGQQSQRMGSLCTPSAGSATGHRAQLHPSLQPQQMRLQQQQLQRHITQQQPVAAQLSLAAGAGALNIPVAWNPQQISPAGLAISGNTGRAAPLQHAHIPHQQLVSVPLAGPAQRSMGALAAAQQQHGLPSAAGHPLHYHRSSASFTGSTASSSTALQQVAAGAINSNMAAGGSAATLQALQQLRQQQQQHELQLHVARQQQLQQLAGAHAAVPSGVPVHLSLPGSVSKAPGPIQVDPAAPAAAAAGLQRLQALKAVATAAAGAGLVAGQQGSLGSAGSGGSPVSAGSSGTAAGLMGTAGSVTPTGDPLGGATAAAAGMMNVLHAQAVVQ